MTRIRSTDDSRIQDRRGQGGGRHRRSPGSVGAFRCPAARPAAAGLIGLIVIAAIIFLPRLLGGGDGTDFLVPEQAQEQAEEGAGDEACQSEAEQIVCGANEDVQDYWATGVPRGVRPALHGHRTRAVLRRHEHRMRRGVVGRPGRSTARPTPSCTSTSTSWISCSPTSERPGTWPPPTSSPTSSATTCRTSRGQNAAVQQASGETQRLMGIALELQADCYAGTWVHDAMQRRTAAGEALIDDGEISEALDAAAAVGDDRIQMQTQGRVDSESFTHGTSEQRESWFRRGYETGDPNQCNTFDEL